MSYTLNIATLETRDLAGTSQVRVPLDREAHYKIANAARTDKEASGWVSGQSAIWVSKSWLDTFQQTVRPEATKVALADVACAVPAAAPALPVATTAPLKPSAGYGQTTAVALFDRGSVRLDMALTDNDAGRALVDALLRGDAIIGDVVQIQRDRWCALGRKLVEARTTYGSGNAAEYQTWLVAWGLDAVLGSYRTSAAWFYENRAAVEAEGIAPGAAHPHHIRNAWRRAHPELVKRTTTCSQPPGSVRRPAPPAPTYTILGEGQDGKWRVRRDADGKVAQQPWADINEAARKAWNEAQHAGFDEDAAMARATESGTDANKGALSGPVLDVPESSEPAPEMTEADGAIVAQGLVALAALKAAGELEPVGSGTSGLKADVVEPEADPELPAITEADFEAIVSQVDAMPPGPRHRLIELLVERFC